MLRQTPSSGSTSCLNRTPLTSATSTVLSWDFFEFCLVRCRRFLEATVIARVESLRRFRNNGIPLFESVLRLKDSSFTFTRPLWSPVGDTWPPSLAVTDEDGNINSSNALFIISFRLVVDWILLQVVISKVECRLCSLITMCSVPARFWGRF